MSIGVSIVNYGTSELVLAALPALMAELSHFFEATVCVVDNASPGGDADRLEAGIAALGDPRIRLIRSKVNGGFAAGNNVAFAAMRDAGPPDVTMLHNPDAIVRPGAIDAMLAVLFSANDIGFVGARLENPDGSTWSPAFRFPSAGQEFARATGLGVFQRIWPLMADEHGPVDWVGGAAVLIRREAMVELGDMDDGYFLYFEEIDYMLRGRKAGWRTAYAPDALVFHDAGGATGMAEGANRKARLPGYWFRSWRRYFEKNHGWMGARWAAASHLAGRMVYFLQRRIRGGEMKIPERFLRDFTRRCLIGRED